MQTTHRLAVLCALPLLSGCVGAVASVATGAASVGAQSALTSGSTTVAGGGASAAQIASLPSDIAPLAVAFSDPIPANLVGQRKVFVPAYAVSYIHTQNVRAVSQGGLMGGFGGGSTRTASVRTGLTGISPETYQRIADEANADLLAQLAAAGIAVATPEETAAAAASATRAPGNALDGSVGGTILGGQSTSWRTLGAAQAPLISGLSGEGAGGGVAGLAAIGGNQALQRMADASQGLVLAPVLRLDYVNVSSSGRSLLSSTYTRRPAMARPTTLPEAAAMVAASSAR